MRSRTARALALAVAVAALCACSPSDIPSDPEAYVREYVDAVNARDRARVAQVMGGAESEAAADQALSLTTGGPWQVSSVRVEPVTNTRYFSEAHVTTSTTHRTWLVRFEKKDGAFVMDRPTAKDIEPDSPGSSTPTGTTGR